jgi:hypothetical protein
MNERGDLILDQHSCTDMLYEYGALVLESQYDIILLFENNLANKG